MKNLYQETCLVHSQTRSCKRFLCIYVVTNQTYEFQSPKIEVTQIIDSEINIKNFFLLVMFVVCFYHVNSINHFVSFCNALQCIINSVRFSIYLCLLLYYLMSLSCLGIKIKKKNASKVFLRLIMLYDIIVRNI